MEEQLLKLTATYLEEQADFAQNNTQQLAITIEHQRADATFLADCFVATLQQHRSYVNPLLYDIRITIRSITPRLMSVFLP